MADPVSEAVILASEVSPKEEYEVFVGNLAFSTSEQRLADFFNKTGKVANIITRGTRSLGYGFVALETEEDAKKVVDELHNQELDGRRINVEVKADPLSEAVTLVSEVSPKEEAKQEYKVFVGNLAFSTSEQRLANFFNKTGKVANIVARGTRSLGFGFVALETEEDAKKVVDELHNQELDGRQIKVKVTADDDPVSEAVTLASEVSPKEETKQGHKVFVGNLAFSTSEQRLANFFNKTGKVIKANIITRGTRSLGYGFVVLETEEDAKKVVDELHNQELDGRQIKVEVTVDDDPVSEAVTLASEVSPKEETKQEYKVFVGNLAFSTSEQRLEDFFNKTCKVIKANIITRGTRSLGYGFVALETEEDAIKVVDLLHNQELDGRRINVEVAKPKAAAPPAPRAPRRGRKLVK